MKDNRSKSENKVDTFFRKVAEEAEILPVIAIDIPSKNHEKAGICLLTEEREPASIDEVAAAITADVYHSTPGKTPQKHTSTALRESLAIEIERARFTSTSLSLVLIKTSTILGDTLVKNPQTILKDALHRVDIVTTLNTSTLAILMPETGGRSAEKRGVRFLASLNNMATGCGIYSNHGNNCPEPEDFIDGALQELERSCSKGGKIFYNTHDEPSSCQVTVEEKNELFNLFGKDKT